MLNKYLDVLIGSVMFPLKHFKDISGLLLMTLLVCMAITYIGILFGSHMIDLPAMNSLVMVVNAVLVLAVLLALMPLYVSVIRHVVLGEKVEHDVLGKMLNAREVMTFVALVKLLFLFVIPIFLVGIIITMMGNDNVVVGLKAEHIMLWLGVLIALFLVARGSMMLVHGALDKDVSIAESFKVTMHHIVYIFISVVSLLLVLCLLYHALMYLYGIIGDLKITQDLLAMDIIGALIVMVVTIFIKMLGGVIFFVGLAKVHLAIAK